jgi:hypothetical protein
MGDCERGDSNPHAFRHQILSLARLPIPPLSHVIRRIRQFQHPCKSNQSVSNRFGRGSVGPPREGPNCPCVTREPCDRGHYGRCRISAANRQRHTNPTCQRGNRRPRTPASAIDTGYPSAYPACSSLTLRVRGSGVAHESRQRAVAVKTLTFPASAASRSSPHPRTRVYRPRVQGRSPGLHCCAEAARIGRNGRMLNSCGSCPTAGILPAVLIGRARFSQTAAPSHRPLAPWKWELWGLRKHFAA